MNMLSIINIFKGLFALFLLLSIIFNIDYSIVQGVSIITFIGFALQNMKSATEKSESFWVLVWGASFIFLFTGFNSFVKSFSKEYYIGLLVVWMMIVIVSIFIKWDDKKY